GAGHRQGPRRGQTALRAGDPRRARVDAAGRHRRRVRAGALQPRQPPRLERRRLLQGRGRQDGRGRRGGDPQGLNAAEPLRSVENLEVVYDDVFLVLRGLSLVVPRGEVVALLGANGAGKSTTLKAISGLLPTEHGEIVLGSCRFDGDDITHVD